MIYIMKNKHKACEKKIMFPHKNTLIILGWAQKSLTLKAKHKRK